MILITGGMGFIGLHTARAFLDAGETVVATMHRSDHVPSFIAGDLGKRFFIERLDVTSPFAVVQLMRRHRVTGIVHLAVPALGTLSPGEEYRVNMSGLLNVLEAGRDAGVRRVSVASSVTVYDGLEAGPFTEDAALPIASRTSTEAFKKAYETLGTWYAQDSGLDVLCLRIGYVYGPLYHSMSNLPSRLLHAALTGRRGPLAPEGTAPPFELDGRDLCYVEDCANAIAAAHLAQHPRFRIYNVGSGVATSNGQVANAVRAVVPNADLVLREGAGPQFRPNAAMDLQRLYADTEFRPKFDIERGIERYAAWLRSGNAA
ncbi:MAG: NAD(P)-dependent oxidoreductase [Candidatus Eremiobacteraeota bacterium]|nr:NAD(P)-dependent oxidoreductase [Candidatus Eremiobacteraeota bacterium]